MFALTENQPSSHLIVDSCKYCSKVSEKRRESVQIKDAVVGARSLLHILCIVKTSNQK